MVINCAAYIYDLIRSDNAMFSAIASDNSSSRFVIVQASVAEVVVLYRYNEYDISDSLAFDFSLR